MKLKNLLVLSTILTLGFMIIGCGKNESADSGWKKYKTIPISHKNNIGGFYNEKFGITVGYAGEIHYSTDGGATWPRGTNNSYCRFGLDIVDQNVAWCCGNGTHIRKTTDGGKTWVAVTNFGKNEPNHCRYISFLDDKIGWTASPDLLGSTTDGGNTWNTLKLPDGIGKILGINLLSEKTGFIIDSNKKLYFTKDGGSSWENKNLGIEDIDVNVYRTNALALGFDNEKNGQLFYFDKNDILKYATTNDGGNTWVKKKAPKTSAFGGLYLSQDNKFLSVNSDQGTTIVVFEKK